jgi:F-type H+-transporting ATPase subunit delta
MKKVLRKMPIKEKRYAQALLEIGIKNNALERFQKDLKVVLDDFLNNDELVEYLLRPEISDALKKELVLDLYKSKISVEIQNLLQVLIDRKSIKNIYGIAKEFSILADEKRNILNIEITSSEPLSEKQLKKICEKYKKEYAASDVKYVNVIDKSIIGGIRIQIGDRLMDGSISTRLKQLQKLLVR